MEGHVSDDTRHQIQNLKAELSELRKLDELWWKQRSKAHWLKEGDRNNKFFHSVASTQRQRNKIVKLKARNTWLENPSDIQHEFISFYEDLFTSTQPNEEIINDIARTVPRKVTDDMNAELTREFTAEEVYAAVKQMRGETAPGPDGFPRKRFKLAADLL
ncbi:hypothetical protein M569_06350 [Genlisea aurea]|uniref:Reverse transcriptase domain-containing protein n=1 Tax=Genlisea aurea TaxID=192259 RepID=S8CMN6_9LAMI|nr:hypothetical protein M569_06350 [Genlisea aurea]